MGYPHAPDRLSQGYTYFQTELSLPPCGNLVCIGPDVLFAMVCAGRWGKQSTLIVRGARRIVT